MNDAIDQIMALMDVAFDPQWNEAWNRRQLTDALQLPSTHYRLIDEAGESRLPQILPPGLPSSGLPRTKKSCC